MPYASFGDQHSDSDDEDPYDALHREWRGQVEPFLKGAVVAVTGINEYNQRIIAYLGPRSVHPLDMMYLHSFVGPRPQSVREKDGLPLLARMTQLCVDVAPVALREEVVVHMGDASLDEMRWLKAVMAFVAKRMFSYADSVKPAKAPRTSSRPGDSLDYARFDRIVDSDDDES